MEGIFPFIQPRIYTADELAVAEELPPYVDVEWNFVSDMPVFVRGDARIVTGLPAVMSWAWRALHQERFLNEIYTWNYGNEIMIMMGKRWQPETKIAEAARYVRECLRVSPYITDVQEITAAFEKSILRIACTVVTMYGAQRLEASYGV